MTTGMCLCPRDDIHPSADCVYLGDSDTPDDEAPKEEPHG